MTFALTNSGLTLRLKDCVYAPSLIANFLSCGKLNERGMDVFGKVRREGSSGRCRLGVRQRRNCCHGTTSRRNVRDGFRWKSTSQVRSIIAATKHVNRSLMDWLKAMGHLYFADLRRFLKTFDVFFKGNDLECRLVCWQKWPVLSDIIRTPLVGNYRYYLTFVDDFSIFTTVYLPRFREEVCDKFAEFKAFVENKFDLKIKKLRSDNGTKYTNYRI